MLKFLNLDLISSARKQAEIQSALATCATITLLAKVLRVGLGDILLSDFLLPLLLYAVTTLRNFRRNFSNTNKGKRKHIFLITDYLPAIQMGGEELI